MSTIPDRIEIRVIGTDELLERAAAIIANTYVILYQRDYYSCKDSKALPQQYYNVPEKEGDLDGQDN